MSNNKRIKVIIPAAGNGTRFDPLTRYIPKEVLPVKYYDDLESYNQKGHGTPILEANLRNLESISERIYVVSNETKISDLKVCVEDTFKKHKLELPICFVNQEKPLGDGDAIYQVIKELCDKCGDLNFLIHYGDLVYNSPKAKEDFEKATTLYFKEKEKDENLVALILTYPIYENPLRFGVLSLEDYVNGLYKVREVVEKPKDEKTQEKLKINNGWYINSGILIINAKELEPYFKEEYSKIEKGKIKEVVLANVISNALKDGKKVLAYPIQGKIEDLGTFNDWIAHHYNLMRK